MLNLCEATVRTRKLQKRKTTFWQYSSVINITKQLVYLATHEIVMLNVSVHTAQLLCLMLLGLFKVIFYSGSRLLEMVFLVFYMFDLRE